RSASPPPGRSRCSSVQAKEFTARRPSIKTARSKRDSLVGSPSAPPLAALIWLDRAGGERENRQMRRKHPSLLVRSCRFAALAGAPTFALLAPGAPAGALP